MKLINVLSLGFLVMSIFFGFQMGFAQTRIITGTVINGITGKPISGVTIEISGVSDVVQSNSNGEYSLSIPDTIQQISFSDFKGMELMEIRNVTTDVIDIYLSEVNLFELSLEELMNIKVVTATKSLQTLTQAPATIIVVTAEQIETRKYRSLLDVLQDLPGFVINDFVYTEGRNSISMRGFDDQSKFIILMDGVKISIVSGEITPIMENYPVHLAKQIEIVYGPASALYGADAVAGVINIITKKIPSDKKFAVEFSPSTGMYGMKNGTLYGGVNVDDDVSFIFSGQLYSEQLAPLKDLVQDKDNFNFSAQETGKFNSNFGTITPVTPYSIELEYPVSAYNLFTALKLSDFNFSLFSNMNQTSSSFPSTGNNAIYNSNVLFNNKITVINGTFTKHIEKFIISSRISTSTYTISPESNYRNAFVNLEPGYKYGFANMWEIEQQISWQSESKLNIIGGVSYALSENIPKTADLDMKVDENKPIQGIIQGTRLPNNPNGIPDDNYFIKYLNIGTYVQALWNPSDIFSITLGTRYDYNSRYSSTLNPRLGIIVTPTPKTTVKALYGSSYLAPSPNMAYKRYGSFISDDNGTTYKSFFWHLPNPDLKPIYMKTTEINVQQFIGKNFSLAMSAYYIWTNNLMKNVPDSGNTNYYNGKYKGWSVAYIDVYINQGNQQNFGFTGEMNYSYKTGNFNIRSYASISYVNAVVETDYTDADNKQRTTYAQALLNTSFISHIGFDLNAGEFTFSPRLTNVGKQGGMDFENPAAPDKRIAIAGYNLLNVTVSYQPSKNISMYCIAANALNSKYASTNEGVTANSTYMYGSPQQPLHITGGFKIIL